MDWLAVGFRFKTLQDLARAVRKQEAESNGAFEFQRCPPTSAKGSSVVFRCIRESPNPKSGSHGMCDAYIKACKRASAKTSWFVIVEKDISHFHNSIDHMLPSTSNNSSNDFTPLDSDATFQENNITFGACSTNEIRRIRHQPLNLINNLIYGTKTGYKCPYCSNFTCLSYSEAQSHMQIIHENDGIWLNGTYFVPCRADCKGNIRRKEQNFHYHCYCDMLLLSKTGLVNHLSLKKCSDAVNKYSIESPSIESDKAAEKPTLANECSLVPFKISSFHSDSIDTFDDDTVKFFRNPDELVIAPKGPTDTASNNVDVAENPLKKNKHFMTAIDSSTPTRRHSSELPNDDLMRTVVERCTSCGQRFDSLGALVRHECPAMEPLTGGREIADAVWMAQNFVGSSTCSNVVCPLCDDRLEAVDALADHYRNKHAQLFGPRLIDQLKVECFTFDNARQFYTWKCDTEVQTFAHYTKKRHVFSTISRDVSIFFACCFSWADMRTSLKGKTKERRCPAFIRATQASDSSTVEVNFCGFHYGHELDKTKFWKKIKKSIHGLLSFNHRAKHDFGNNTNDDGHLPGTSRSVNDLHDEQTLMKPGDSNDSVQIVIGGWRWRRNFNSDNDGTVAKNSDQRSDLDRSVGYYWELMKGHLNSSDNFSHSIEGRWMNSSEFKYSEDKSCKICRIDFKNRKSLLRHMLGVHNPKHTGPSKSKYRKPVRCLLCNMELAHSSMKSLIQHYINAHDQQIKLKMRLFEEIEDFNEWRAAVTSRFFRRHKTYKSPKGEVRQYWTCKYNGQLQMLTNGAFDGHCPAWIFAEFLADGFVQVSYCLYHIGHSIEPEVTSPDDVMLPSSDQSFINEADIDNQTLQSRGGLSTKVCSVSSVIIPVDSVSVDLELRLMSSHGCGGDDGTFGDARSSGMYASLFANSLLSSGAESKNLSGSVDLAEGVTSNFDFADNSNEILGDKKSVSFSDVGVAATVDCANDGKSGLGIDLLDVQSVVDYCSSKTDDVIIAGSSGQMLQNSDDLGQCVASSSSSSGQQHSQPDCSVFLRNDVSVVLRCANGDTKLVKIPLSDFPLVTDEDGKEYYALEESSLINCVSQILTKGGDQLCEGDQLEILQ